MQTQTTNEKPARVFVPLNKKVHGLARLALPEKLTRHNREKEVTLHVLPDFGAQFRDGRHWLPTGLCAVSTLERAQVLLESARLLGREAYSAEVSLSPAGLELSAYSYSAVLTGWEALAAPAYPASLEAAAPELEPEPAAPELEAPLSPLELEARTYHEAAVRELETADAHRLEARRLELEAQACEARADAAREKAEAAFSRALEAALPLEPEPALEAAPEPPQAAPPAKAPRRSARKPRAAKAAPVAAPEPVVRSNPVVAAAYWEVRDRIRSSRR